MDGRIRSLHLQRRGQERAAPLEWLGNAEHQQSQLPDLKEVLLGCRGVCQELYAQRRKQITA